MPFANGELNGLIADLAEFRGPSDLLCSLSSDMKAWKNVRRGVGASMTPLIRLSNASRLSGVCHISVCFQAHSRAGLGSSRALQNPVEFPIAEASGA